MKTSKLLLLFASLGLLMGSCNQPAQSGSNPGEPGTDPVEPGTDPVDPGTDPVDPGTDPVDPGTDPVDPGTDPVDPGTDPVDPGTDPVDPGTDPEEGGELVPGDITVDFSDAGFENGEEVTEPLSGYGITLTFAAGSNEEHAPTYYTSGTAIRMYAGNTLKVEAQNLTKIEFTFDSKAGEFQASTGSFSNNTVWEGKTDSLTLTVKTGQRRVQTMTIYCDLDESDSGDVDPDFDFLDGWPSKEYVKESLGVDIEIPALQGEHDTYYAYYPSEGEYAQYIGIFLDDENVEEEYSTYVASLDGWTKEVDADGGYDLIDSNNTVLIWVYFLQDEDFGDATYIEVYVYNDLYE